MDLLMSPAVRSHTVYEQAGTSGMERSVNPHVFSEPDMIERWVQSVRVSAAADYAEVKP
jgi:hypothetical protein